MPRLLTARTAAIALMVAATASEAMSWTLTLGNAQRRLFLHVGDGRRNADHPTVNTVAVTVLPSQLGTGQALPMTSNSTQSTTLYTDNFVTCPSSPGTQVLIGASYQRQNANNGPASATLRVSSPATLNNANGDTIPISEIRWVVSGPGENNAPPPQTIVGAGFFQGTANQFLATIPANRYIENCHSFSYLNTAIRAAGTYLATVTYTVSAP